MRDVPFVEARLKKAKLAENDSERAAAKRLPYLEVIGSLLYACITHPECSFVTSYLCKLMKDPTEDAFNAALIVLEYLYDHRHEGLTYVKDYTAPCLNALQDRRRK